MAAQRYAQPEPFSVQLFGFETGGGYASSFWQQPQTFSLQYWNAYQQWKRTKRSFTVEEIINGYWVYISLQGAAHILQFLQNRIVQGTALFDAGNQFQGTWEIIGIDVGSILRFALQNQAQFTVFANRQGSIHSGVAYPGGKNPPTYFRFIAVR